jgi:hypothetical protein
MSFDVKLTPELGKALLAWDDRLFGVWQACMHSRAMVPALVDAGFTLRAREAAEISNNIHEQLVTGELVTRMSRMHAKKHPCLRGGVESELLRQFSNVLVPFLFADISEERKGDLEAQVEQFRVAANAATEEEK